MQRRGLQRHFTGIDSEWIPQQTPWPPSIVPGTYPLYRHRMGGLKSSSSFSFSSSSSAFAIHSPPSPLVPLVCWGYTVENHWQIGLGELLSRYEVLFLPHPLAPCYLLCVRMYLVGRMLDAACFTSDYYRQTAACARWMNITQCIWDPANRLPLRRL